MKKHLLILASLLLAVACGGGSKPANEEQNNGNSDDEKHETTEVTDFALGSDISWLSEMEADGRKFSDDKGHTDLIGILKALEQNSIRLRVWVSPPDSKGWSGKSDMISLAKRAAAAGMAVMVDFHYSDFFADPSKQVIPENWTDHSVTALSQKVSFHTTDVLKSLKDAGVTPAWVQIGNETRNGMLWPTGQLWENDYSKTPGGFADFAKLFNAGADAAKAVFPEVKVIAHVNKASSSEDNLWWFKELIKQGGKFDICGLSHYPMVDGTDGWKTLNARSIAALKALHAGVGKPVMIVETGIRSSDFADGAACIADEMSKFRSLDFCEGVFYWEPEVYGGWKPAIYSNIPSRFSSYPVWDAYDMGAFTSEGKPSDAIKAMK